MVVGRRKDGFLKAGLYSHDLNSVVECIVDKLCYLRREALLNRDASNNIVHVLRLVGEISQRVSKSQPSCLLSII